MDKNPKSPTNTSPNDTDYSYGYSKKEVDALKTMLHKKQPTKASSPNKHHKNNDKL